MPCSSRITWLASARSYHYTSDKWKYLKRLFLFVAIFHFPYMLYFQCSWWKTTCVTRGLAMGLGALMVVKSRRLSGFARGRIFLLCCAASLISIYDVLAVLWIVASGIYRDDFKRQMQAPCLIDLIGWPSAPLPSLVTTGWLDFYRVGILLAIPLLALYDGQRGSRSAFAKYAFYVFFPLHHLILYVHCGITVTAICRCRLSSRSAGGSRAPPDIKGAMWRCDPKTDPTDCRLSGRGFSCFFVQHFLMAATRRISLTVVCRPYIICLSMVF
ncbi:MAG: TraX family protein [Oscillibacter sp.]|nr:TraX family protein [Oscillibacter sp.]